MNVPPPLFQNLILSPEIHLAQTLEELSFSLALTLDNLQRGMDLEEGRGREREREVLISPKSPQRESSKVS